jgi:ABC-type uncharacterized transport system fused permease/ATPase subunit
MAMPTLEAAFRSNLMTVSLSLSVAVYVGAARELQRRKKPRSL